MSDLRQVRDTFLHFMADNLTSDTVHAIRRDPNNTAAGVFQGNAINISFGPLNPQIQVGTQDVYIDIVNEVELDAVDQVNRVWNVLNKAFYTPLQDYTVPSAPVAVGSNVMWARNSVMFREISSEYYFHYNCSMTLQFHS